MNDLLAQVIDAYGSLDRWKNSIADHDNCDPWLGPTDATARPG